MTFDQYFHAITNPNITRRTVACRNPMSPNGVVNFTITEVEPKPSMIGIRCNGCAQLWTALATEEMNIITTHHCRPRDLRDNPEIIISPKVLAVAQRLIKEGIEPLHLTRRELQEAA